MKKAIGQSARLAVEIARKIVAEKKLDVAMTFQVATERMEIRGFDRTLAEAAVVEFLKPAEMGQAEDRGSEIKVRLTRRQLAFIIEALESNAEACRDCAQDDETEAPAYIKDAEDMEALATYFNTMVRS